MVERLTASQSCSKPANPTWVYRRKKTAGDFGPRPFRTWRFRTPIGDFGGDFGRCAVKSDGDFGPCVVNSDAAVNSDGDFGRCAVKFGRLT